MVWEGKCLSKIITSKEGRAKIFLEQNPQRRNEKLKGISSRKYFVAYRFLAPWYDPRKSYNTHCTLEENVRPTERFNWIPYIFFLFFGP